MEKRKSLFVSVVEREELVWGMREAALEEKKLEEEDSSSLHPFDLLSTRDEKYTLSYKTKILTSFVPDELIRNFKDYSLRESDTCILCGDVSGFTELCEAYNKTGSGGPSKLTDMLNSFIGVMVQEIMSYGGDVFKFSGDAFLSIWKCAKNQSYMMRDFIQKAINVALVIQKNHNNYVTDVGVKLRVKLAISAGTLLFSLIGDAESSHYIEVGEPILDIKKILDLCKAGDIIISRKAFAYIDNSAYLTKEIQGGKYIKVFGVGPTWRQVQTLNEPLYPSSEGMETKSNESIFSKRQVRSSSNFALRPLINHIRNTALIYKNLKRFIIPPVMKSIEQNEALEHLTECRYTTTMMINIVPKAVPFESLIVLVRSVYRIISIHSKKYSGCINKISFFDKDLMCVLIFGLRGLKLNLECRNALRCADLIHGDITVLPNIESISIGIANGKTYCGVFGHSLRREYTVIGLPVNKAARLMVNYPNKVTCCSETFINSKMMDIYFKKQKEVYLKGIKKPGPVYEFKFSVVQYALNSNHEYPILGRDEEMSKYIELLHIFFQTLTAEKDATKIVTMIIVTGESKCGKTRLIEEFLYITPKIPIQIVYADYNMTDLTCNVLKEIYCAAMYISKDSPPEIIEKNIRNCMKIDKNEKEKFPLCSINKIFKVSFPETETFKNASDAEKLKFTLKTLRKLSIFIFKSPRLIVIERLMMEDELTFSTLRQLLRLKSTFFIISFRDSDSINIPTQNVICKSKRIHTMHLGNIDKLYHSALVCQMLGVHAISPDLEYLIQSRSNGNPGFIKNFLICMLGAEAIGIESSTYEEINTDGLIVPKLYFMTRISNVKLTIWRKIMEERPINADNSITNWFKYIDICREAYLNVGVREEMMKDFGLKLDVKCCVITDEFENFNEERKEFQETAIISTFDSLSYTEQFVVKCGSVLGWQFRRSMLEYLLGENVSTRETAEAIQKLFERRIFGCSKGDFLESGSYLLIRDKKEESSSENQPVQCNCVGLNIPFCCLDLPTYASCGYIHFKSNQFLQDTYNLLPETQKIEFHSRAAKYFKEKTRKCCSCGNGFFEEFTARNFLKELKVPKKWRNEIKITNRKFDEDRSFISVSEVSSEKSKSSEVLYNFKDEFRFFQINYTNPKKLIKMKESPELVRTFSAFDFSNCKCQQILNYTYGEISKHYKVSGKYRGIITNSRFSGISGQYDQMLKTMMSYAKSCVALENTAEAFIVLKQIEEHLQTRGINPNEPSWKLRLLEGNVLVIRAQTFLQENQDEMALKLLLSAMEKYGAPFPTSNFGRLIKSYTKIFKQKIGLYLHPSSLTTDLKNYEATYFNDVAECLIFMTEVFNKKGEKNKLELAAVWALQYALKANINFRTIIKCFTNILNFKIIQEDDALYCSALEVHSLLYCHKKHRNLEFEDLVNVAKLYNEITLFRLTRSEIEKAIYMGYTTLRLSISVNCVDLIYNLVPTLTLALLIKCYLSDACSLMNELDYYSRKMEDKRLRTGRTFFYSCSLIFHLETGYTYLPYRACRKFFYSSDLDLVTMKNSNAFLLFISVMFLWNCRNGHWEVTAKLIKDFKITQLINHIDQKKKINLYTVMYSLESYLLLWVHSIDNQNFKSSSYYEEAINVLLKKMDKFSGFKKVIVPRMKHLEAYYYYVKGDEEKARKILESTSVIAAKYQNALELNHINHTKMAWQEQLSRRKRDEWKIYSKPDNLIEYASLENDDHKIISYTFPKPMYL